MEAAKVFGAGGGGIAVSARFAVLDDGLEDLDGSLLCIS